MLDYSTLNSVPTHVTEMALCQMCDLWASVLHMKNISINSSHAKAVMRVNRRMPQNCLKQYFVYSKHSINTFHYLYENTMSEMENFANCLAKSCHLTKEDNTRS